MSAYAMPGLFPPIDTISVDDTRDVSQSCSIESSDNDDSCGNAQDSSEKNIPLHHQDGNNGNYSTKMYWSGCEGSDAKSRNIGCLMTCAAIAVKEAKIDPVRWIQYVTGSNPQQYARQIGKTLRRRVYGGNTSPQVSPVGRKPTVSSRLSNVSGSTTCSTSNSPHNEAIEFELAITLNGRRYTAKRTMQCIMHFRDDLIREMKRRKQWLTETQALQLPYGSTAHSSSYFNSTQNSNHKNTRQESSENKGSYAVQIPEIPPLNGNGDRKDAFGDSGFVGKGFTMLHAMVTSYVPVMESWFKNVMEIVPQDSECLINFLWEPSNNEIRSDSCKSVLDSINNGHYNTGDVKKFKSSTSLATLGSIKEMECSTDDDDSDDEDGHFSITEW
jgi:hypothetical protein